MIENREQAYAMLDDVAAWLLQHEPHSPVPHLLRTAAHWGTLDTTGLYQEVFLRNGGQLNIFEMLGLQPSQPQG